MTNRAFISDTTLKEKLTFSGVDSERNLGRWVQKQSWLEPMDGYAAEQLFLRNYDENNWTKSRSK